MFLMAALLLTYPLMMMLAPIAPGTTAAVLAFVEKRRRFAVVAKHFLTRNDYICFLLFVAVFSQNLIFGVLYCWSRRFPTAQANIWGIPVPAMYLPFAHLVLVS